MKEAGGADVDTHREQTARARVGGLVVLQLIARGYTLGHIAQLRWEAMAGSVVALRDTLDALGVDTVRGGVRKAQRRQLIV